MIIPEIMGDALVVAFGAWSAFTFYKIIRHKKVTYIEPNMKILIGEACLSGLAFLLGVFLVIQDGLK